MAVEDNMIHTVKKSVNTANDVLLLDKLVKIGFKYDDSQGVEDDILTMVDDIREWKKLLKKYLKQIGEFKNESTESVQ